jgi:hypothetical protein
MPGTRENIIAQVVSWTEDQTAPNILWLKGHPGAGKSAIASSLVEQMIKSKRLGSSFFFQRDNVQMSTPNSLWRMVAFDLGRQYPGVRRCLVEKLRTDEIHPITINTLSFFRHFIQDPLLASEDIPLGRLPVIIVDALDECGGLEGRLSVHRPYLMKNIFSWSKLPSKFKLIVTSRSEADIEQVFQTTHHCLVELPTGNKVDNHSSKDIKGFFKHEFGRISTEYPSLSTQWPGSAIIDQLTEKAAGLFIWAKTAIRLIDMGIPTVQLEHILEGSNTTGMAALYSRVLDISFPQPTQATIEAFHSIFGAIMFTKRPLPVSSIACLLSVNGDTVEYICGRMRSVLDIKSLLRISHQSFTDFLLDPNICPPAFLINSTNENRRLTTACLRIMKESLRFNICRIESSHIPNRDIPDLKSRIEQNITPELSYSSCFWANHLENSQYNIEILVFLLIFMDNQFLYWLEVLSLLNQVGLASGMLQVLINWIRVRSKPLLYSLREILKHLTEISRRRRDGRRYAEICPDVLQCDSRQCPKYLLVCNTVFTTTVPSIEAICEALSTNVNDRQGRTQKLASCPTYP